MAQKLAELQKARGAALGSDSGMMNFERQDAVPSQASSTTLTTQEAIRGSIEQFQALILPPEFADNGNARGDTSKFVVKGRQQDYQALKVGLGS